LYKKALNGLGKVISGPFYFKSWSYNPNINSYPFNLDKAKELLRSAGWIDSDNDGCLDKDGQAFKIEFLIYAGSETVAQLVSIVQANLKELLIDVSIRTLEWSVYLDRIRKGKFDAYSGGWSLGFEPDLYGIWHSSQINIGNNFIGYENEEIDKLLEEVRREFDREKRKKMCWRIHEIIHRDQPYTFVFTPMDAVIISKRITNYSVSPFGLFEFFPGQLAWEIH